MSHKWWVIVYDSYKRLEFLKSSPLKKWSAVIFDHQLCFDSRLKLLFCFGGRVVKSTLDVPLEEFRLRRGMRVRKYGGLYKWKKLTRNWTWIQGCIQELFSIFSIFSNFSFKNFSRWKTLHERKFQKTKKGNKRAGHGMVINDQLRSCTLSAGRGQNLKWTTSSRSTT